MMGTFFTVPQEFPAERRRIFTRAGRHAEAHRRVRLSQPRGRPHHDREIGHFNKGAFHLATDPARADRADVFHIPPEIDPGLGLDARPGTVDVYVLPPIDTTDVDGGGRRREQGARARVSFARTRRCDAREPT